MLSSDSKPVASTWLDRLRLSRGFSTTENDDASGNPLTLDDFLRRNHHTEITGEPTTSSASDSPPLALIPSDPELAESPPEPNRSEWYGMMTDVLSELFNFGSSSRSSAIPGKKFPRKQSNPKHCSVETPEHVPPPPNQKRELIPGVREFATSSRSSYNKKPAPEIKERRRIVAEADGVDEEEEEKDLIGFSRSEVTVIDTSFDIWKSEKLVFRRRNVWKVKDKKGVLSLKKKKTTKMMMIKEKKKKKKKRKCDVDDDEIARKSKKMKISRSVLDNNRRNQIDEVRDDPESSNVNQSGSSRLPSKLRKVGAFGIQTSKRNNEPEARGNQSTA